jgi:dihydropteroate synthase
VPLDEERARLAPILPAVLGLGIPVSIDTMKAAVAAWALETGAAIVNDVWGLQRDPDMAHVVAGHDVPVIVMHNRDAADPRIDIVADVTAFFERSLAIAARAGILRERIVLDPGIGFGKTPEQSLICIARLDAWRGFGLPLLVGASRKRFIHSIVPSEPAERLGGSLAAHLLAVENGAAIIRVHDVAPTVQALAVAAAIRRAR